MSDRFAEVMKIHQDLLERWRAAMDLVGPGPTAPHFEDAAGAVDGLEARGRWADLGSGAGFPGIALAAASPDAEVWLVESRQKRAIFLEKVVFAAGLTKTRVIRERAESLPAGHFDGLISRAFMPPEPFLELAAGLLAPEGRVAVLLGDRDWAPPAGWQALSEHRYAVPDGWRRRVLVRRDP